MTSGGHNEVKFKAAILGLSTSSDWDEAKAEWDLHFVYVDPNERACECEHSPIHQICVIKNRTNNASTEVGNVCVKRFLRLLSNRIFSVLKRLQFDIQKSLNPKALDLFQDRGVISYSEAEEYKSYWRKRTTLSDDQKKQKLDINERVLAYFTKEAAILIAKAKAAGIVVSKPQTLP
ncbi:MAG: hypothetical protein ACO1NM_11635 [Sphingobium phenoxybenzoativorans]